MPPDTIYTPVPFIFVSRGLTARNIPDQPPDGTYLNLDSAEEREESAMSSRFGSQIVNRDPEISSMFSGVNYYLPSEINTLTRLKSSSSTWRYAGDVEGNLWRRQGDSQGPYTEIYTGLSGKPFSFVVNTTFGSSLPYLFIADAGKMIKDSGTGTPTSWGIFAPTYTANDIPYAPQVYLIDGFYSAAGSYTSSGISGLSAGTIGTVVVSGSPTSILNGNFYLWTSVVSGITYLVSGMLATFGGGGGGGGGGGPQIPIDSINSCNAFGLQSPPYVKADVVTDSAHGLMVGDYARTTGTSNTFFNGIYRVTDVISPTEFYEQKSSQYFQDSEGGYTQNNSGGGGGGGGGTQALIFDVVTTPYTSQFAAVGVGSTLDITQTNYVLQDIYGLIAASTEATLGKTVSLDLSQRNQATSDDLIVLVLQVGGPQNIASASLDFDINGSGYMAAWYSHPLTFASNAGESAWVTYYLRMGDFIANGQAGQLAFAWANVTGWRIRITTNASGNTEFAVNALYQQWGYGPSSFGGVGYDYRYTYLNFDTKTESNGSPQQYSDQQYGYVSSLGPTIVLRQAIEVYGQYSNDPQVSHVVVYRRGGTLNQNWYYLDMFPNVTSGGQWSYQDVIPDSQIEQSSALVLDNDVPVTSSLIYPISTRLSAGTTGPGDYEFELFVPQTITVADSSVTFVQNQIVLIGNPANLEEVYVITGGTGSFTGIVRLIHNAGEPVSVSSIPGQPCDLVALAYNQMWLAGDVNNPHFLYYSNPGYPENFGPQNYIPVSQPSDPIMAVINWRGALYVATLTTWYLIIGGASPYAQPTGSKHGLVAKHGWCQAESAIYYQAVDGIREFTGSDGRYVSLPIEWLFRKDPNTAALTPIIPADTANLAAVTMAFYNNVVYVVYPGLDGNNHRVKWDVTYSRWRNDDVNCTCLPDEAEILTRDGWKHNWELQIGEEVLGYDLDSKTSKWTQVTAINRYDYDGDLVRWQGGVGGRKFEFLCTDNHKWVWKREANLTRKLRVTRESLEPASAIRRYGDVLMAAPLDNSESRSLLTKREAAILGWLVTDGSICIDKRRKRRTGRIFQSERSKYVSEILDLLGSDMTSRNSCFPRGFPHATPLITFFVAGKFIHHLLAKAGYNSKADLPRIAAQLNGDAAAAMLTAMLHAEASLYGGRATFFQNRGPVIEAVRILCALTGHASCPPRDIGHDPCAAVAVMKKAYIDCIHLKRSRERYKGRVWCPTTGTGTWVARFRDRVSITGNSIFTEEDTNTLLYAKNTLGSLLPNGWAIVQDQVGDYDDGGWVDHILVQDPIAVTIQLPYRDVGKPHNPKQYNVLEIDTNTAGQNLGILLYIDDKNTTLNLGTVSSTRREKIQVPINAGEGVQAYRVSPQLSISVTEAPIIYQLNIYTAVLAAFRGTWDTYQIKFGTDEFKMAKEGLFDYTSTRDIEMALYADGATVPYYTFTLPANPTRTNVPMRVRFAARKFRLWRCVGQSFNLDGSAAGFQFWTAPQISVKLAKVGGGYEMQALVV